MFFAQLSLKEKYRFLADLLYKLALHGGFCGTNDKHASENVLSLGVSTLVGFPFLGDTIV